MTFADSNRGGIYYIEEATFDTTPASGVSRTARLTGSTLSATKETVVSDELRADRMVSDVVEVAAMSGGDINIEWSMFAYDDFMEGFLAGTWSRDQFGFRFEGSTVSWTGTDELTITGREVEAYFVVGNRIKTEGFASAENNGYFQISAVDDSTGDTVVTVTTTTCVAETGNANSVVYDANDVIILNNTAIRAGTGGNSSFDSNGGNAFAAAIAAGQLVVGQNIYVDGLGYGLGTITIAAGVISDAAIITISDGSLSVAFEFESAGGVTAGNVEVAPGADEGDSGDNLAAAINAQRVAGNINVSASSDGAGVVTVKNLNGAGGSITETADPGTDLTIVDFAGGDDDLHGFFEITAVADDEITVTPAPPTDANTGGLGVTVKGGILRNPGTVADITARSYSIETQFTDIGQYMSQKGMRVGGFNLETASGAIVTGSFSFMGTQTARGESAILSEAPYTPVEAANFDVVNATTNVGALKKDGATLSTALQSISLTGDASLRNQMAVSSKFPRGIGLGRFSLEGTMVAYFEDGTMYDHFIDHDTISLQFRYTDLQNNHQIWTIPALKINSDPVAPQGIDQDVLENLEFVAFRDATLNCMLQLDRFSSTEPTTVTT